MSADAQIHDNHHGLMIDNKKLFMWLFLGSDCMFFGTMISTHLIYRKLYPESFDPTTLFSLELTSFSTFILLMSSFLMALAVSAMHKADMKSFRRNVIGVIFFGLIFGIDPGQIKVGRHRRTVFYQSIHAGTHFFNSPNHFIRGTLK